MVDARLGSTEPTQQLRLQVPRGPAGLSTGPEEREWMSWFKYVGFDDCMGGQGGALMTEVERCDKFGELKFIVSLLLGV